MTRQLYYIEERKEKTWDFTLDLTYFPINTNRALITKVWQVDETNVDSHTVFPG